MKTLTAKRIAWLLATDNDSPFHIRRQLCVVPNVSWGFLPWEADLLCLTRAGYLTEIEIKISLSDWKADAAKLKWTFNAWHTHTIKRFFYAAPIELARRWPEIEMPDPGAGVIGIRDDHRFSIEVIRDARARAGFRKLNDEEQLSLLRLAAIKAWGLAHHPDTPLLAEEIHENTNHS